MPSQEQTTAAVCPDCQGKKYVIVWRELFQRGQRLVVQACDTCQYEILSDQDAAYMAKEAGIDCETVYPFEMRIQ